MVPETPTLHSLECSPLTGKPVAFQNVLCRPAGIHVFVYWHESLMVSLMSAVFSSWFYIHRNKPSEMAHLAWSWPFSLLPLAEAHWTVVLALLASVWSLR